MAKDSYSCSDWFKYITRTEIDFLKELARSFVHAPVVINIGAGAGTSGLAFYESRKDITIYTVDIIDTGSPWGLDIERNEFASSSIPKEKWPIQIHKDSALAGNDWQENNIDMVFVDGGHSYECCKADIIAWFPKIKSGGIIAFHDYKEGPSPILGDFYAPGVKQAIDENILTKDGIEKIEQRDTIIAFKKTE